MLLDSTVAAVYDRRWSTKGRLVLDILKCSAGVSPAMVSGSAHASGTQAHASRGDAEKMRTFRKKLLCLTRVVIILGGQPCG